MGWPQTVSTQRDAGATPGHRPGVQVSRCAVQGGARRCRAVWGVQVRLVVLGGEVGGSSSLEIVVCVLRFETFQEFQKDVRRVLGCAAVKDFAMFFF